MKQIKLFASERLCNKWLRRNDGAFTITNITFSHDRIMIVYIVV